MIPFEFHQGTPGNSLLIVRYDGPGHEVKSLLQSVSPTDQKVEYPQSPVIDEFIARNPGVHTAPNQMLVEIDSRRDATGNLVAIVFYTRPYPSE